MALMSNRAVNFDKITEREIFKSGSRIFDNVFPEPESVWLLEPIYKIAYAKKK